MSKAINLQATSAWDSAEQIVRLCAELLPHINRAIDAEQSSYSYEDYLHECEHHGFISPEEEVRFYEDTGKYYAENVNKLETLRKLLSWLAENTL